MHEQAPREGDGDLFGLAACLGVLCGNLVWIVPALGSGRWEAIGLLPFATPIGAAVGLAFAGVAWASIAVCGDRLPKPLVAGAVVALTGAAVVLVAADGYIDPLYGLVGVVGPGALAAVAVALRRRLRRAPMILLASTLVLSVSVVVAASVNPARPVPAAVAAADAVADPGGTISEPTPFRAVTNAEAEADARHRAADIRAAAGEVSWVAEPAVVGYPCAGSDGLLGSAVSYSFSGSFRTDPVAVATDPPSELDVAAVQRMSAALTSAGFTGRAFASGTASTEFVGGDPAAPEQLLIAHGGSVTSVTYVGACVDGD